MSYSPKVAVKSEALAVAMCAKDNSLDGEAVDTMREKAEEWLTSDQPLFRAIMEFATHYPLVSRDPDALFARRNPAPGGDRTKQQRCAGG